MGATSSAGTAPDVAPMDPMHFQCVTCTAKTVC